MGRTCDRFVFVRLIQYTCPLMRRLKILRRLVHKGPRRNWYDRSQQDQMRYADQWFERAELGGMPTAEGFSAQHLFLWKDPVPRVTFPKVMPARGLKLPGDELVLGVER